MDRGLDGLDRVEVAVLPDERRAQCRDDPGRLASRTEVRSHELSRLVHLLVAIEQARELLEQCIRDGVRLWSRSRVAGTLRKRSRRTLIAPSSTPRRARPRKIGAAPARRRSRT